MEGEDVCLELMIEPCFSYFADFAPNFLRLHCKIRAGLSFD